MKAKVLVIIPDSNLGGVTSSAVNFCTELVRNGYMVDVLVQNGTKLPLNVTVGYLKLKGLGKFWKLGFSDFKKATLWMIPVLLILSILKKGLIRCNLWYPFVFLFSKIRTDYDVVVAYRQCAPCYYFATHCVSAGKKISMIHGDYSDKDDYSSWDFMMGDFDYNVCVSDASTKAWRNHYPAMAGKFSTLYNMFDVQEIIKSSKKKDIVDFCINTVNLISIARIENALKNIDRIPETCFRLKKEGIPNFHWYVVGDGPDFDIDKRLAEKYGVSDVLTFCGCRSNPFPLLAKADLFVLTSSSESYGMVLKEALILGKPVVAMRYPALSEIIEDGINGLIAEQNVDSLTSQICLMLQDDKKLLKIMEDNIKLQEVTNVQALKQFESLL